MTDEIVRVLADGAVEVRVLVVPGASRSSVVGRHGDALRLRIAAPAEGGRANRAVIDLLAAELGLRSGDLELVAGAASRTKRVRVRVADSELDPIVERLRLLLG